MIVLFSCMHMSFYLFIYRVIYIHTIMYIHVQTLSFTSTLTFREGETKIVEGGGGVPIKEKETHY